MDLTMNALKARCSTLILAFAAIAPVAATAQTPSLAMELEGGLTWQSFNDVEIPNDGTASRFDLADVVGSGPFTSGRLYVTWNVAERHGLRLLLAPFSLTEAGVPAAPLRFAGADYQAGVPVEANYKFNSYRLSYRWRMHSGESTTAWVGFTGKIRDASIGLTQGATTSKKDDLGFVPLLHLAGDWKPQPSWTLSIDADGLAGGPGRAVDASIKAGYDVGNGWTIRAGYRTVEGGADVESVYSFTWLHYAAVSIQWSR
jgi:hypothetical protein